jgi:hypothetical protein
MIMSQGCWLPRSRAVSSLGVFAMRHILFSLLASATISTFFAPVAVGDLVIAADDASAAAYDDGWSAGDNGGSGFAAWSFVGHDSGNGQGGGFIANQGSQPAVSIGTGASNEAFGIYGHNDNNNGNFGVGAAVRPFASPLQVGWTFSIAMDNQGVKDTVPVGTVGFSLRNSTNDNLAEFYFRGGDSNYTLNAANVSGTTPGWTTDGLKLTFTLTAANSFAFTIDRLGNGPGVDHTLMGNLFSNANQSISNIRLFNANGGEDVFFNSMSISAVPETPAFAIGLLVCSLVGLTCGFQALRRKRSAATPIADR